MTSEAATYRVYNPADTRDLVIKVARLVELVSYSVGLSAAAFYTTERAVDDQYG